MLYAPPPHIADMIQTIRQFLQEEAYPLERIYIPRGFKGAEKALEPLRQKVKAMGLWAPHMPKEYGGLGLSLTEFAYISEELGRSVFGHYLFNSQAPDIGNITWNCFWPTAAKSKRSAGSNRLSRATFAVASP